MPQQDYNLGGSDGDSPTTELDMMSGVVDPTMDDPFLDEVNLGTGHYSRDDYFEQLNLFRDGMFADATFTTILANRVVHQTKRELGEVGWIRRNDDGVQTQAWAPVDDTGHTSALERGEEIWNELHQAERIQAMNEFAGLGPDWTPPHFRMVKARHETSKSLGARLLDNLFERVKKVLGNGTSSKQSSSDLLGRSS